MGQLLSPDAINSLGLSLDIAGVVLLFFFGLPPDIHGGGGMVISWLAGENQASNAKRYRRARALSRLGLVLVAGFGLQIASNHAGAHAPFRPPASCSQEASWRRL